MVRLCLECQSEPEDRGPGSALRELLTNGEPLTDVFLTSTDYVLRSKVSKIIVSSAMGGRVLELWEVTVGWESSEKFR